MFFRSCIGMVGFEASLGRSAKPLLSGAHSEILKSPFTMIVGLSNCEHQGSDVRDGRIHCCIQTSGESSLVGEATAWAEARWLGVD